MPPLRLGVEEELHLVDVTTGRATAAALPLLERVGTDDVVPEIKQSVVESNSRPVFDLDELAADLRRLRTAVVGAGREIGVAPLAAGSSPLVDDTATGTFPKERYERMVERFPDEARAQLVCGCQTHVQIDDPVLAVEVVNRARRFAPAMLALAASSPMWFGRDTGWASYRTLVWEQWPGTNMPGWFAGPEEYDATVRALLDAGVILDEGMVYFDIRRSSHNPTVEFRVCDSVPSVDDAVTLAGLWRAIAQTCLDEVAAGAVDASPRIEVLRAARLQAARHGLSGDLVDPIEPRMVPALNAVDRLLDAVRPALVSAGDEERVAHGVAAMTAGGGWSGRIRSWLADGDPENSAVRRLTDITAR